MLAVKLRESAKMPSKSDQMNIGRVRLSLRYRVESGSADGGTFSDIVFIPYLVGILMLGIFIALVGFWRVGASLASQMSVQVGSVAPTQGDSTLVGAWNLWTNSAGPSNGFTVNSSQRTVSGQINTSQIFNYLGFGPYSVSISAKTEGRSERFYPGGPVCSGTNCGE
jgi:hypothetical protein